jgi:hypothetical protein
MSDYTPTGLQKLSHQVAEHPQLIRCPRDSVVMRVLGSRAECDGTHGVRHEAFVGMPKERAWRVVEIDVECPACRRRALHVRPVPRRSERAGTAT